MKILLVGNPNVGKSVLFSRLTGVRAIASNYPGTTVGYTRGRINLRGEPADVVDVPGAYTLESSSEAERIAAEMLSTGDVVINVVDATNLERNLYLTLELLERRIPMVVALNMWDDAAHRGIKIDFCLLSRLLKVPVVPTVAVTGQGIRELTEAVARATPGDDPVRTREERWVLVGKILREVQRLTPRRHTWSDRLADASVQPFTGLALAIAVLILSFYLVRGLAEGLIRLLLDPFFMRVWLPLLSRLSTVLGGSGLWHDVIVGKLIRSTIDFEQSFGLLSTGLYIEFAVVLPYLVSFYLVLGLLEDVGYLPRLAVLTDTAMHRMGLHGYAIIPSMLGLGCNVPAILGTRILESRKQRFIASTLIAIAVPCAALQAMIFGVVGHYGARYVAVVFGTLGVIWVVSGFILRHAVPGFAHELLIEIPPYRRPRLQAVAQKLWLRVGSFLREAAPVILVTVAAVNVAYFLGLFEGMARFMSPLLTKLWGLPKEAVIAVLVGFLRKDVAVAMLAPLSLTAKQATVATVVLATFFPCLATFTILVRELGWRDMIKATLIMIAVATAVGTLLNRLPIG
ncbi:MAG: FeoB small GTPase domain-containing protein [Kiritimatiellia bacterium]